MQPPWILTLGSTVIPSHTPYYSSHTPYYSSHTPYYTSSHTPYDTPSHAPLTPAPTILSACTPIQTYGAISYTSPHINIPPYASSHTYHAYTPQHVRQSRRMVLSHIYPLISIFPHMPPLIHTMPTPLSMYANPDVWCYLSSGQVSNGFVMDDTAPLVDETTTTAATGDHPL